MTKGRLSWWLKGWLVWMVCVGGVGKVEGAWATEWLNNNVNFGPIKLTFIDNIYKKTHADYYADVDSRDIAQVELNAFVDYLGLKEKTLYPNREGALRQAKGLQDLIDKKTSVLCNSKYVKQYKDNPELMVPVPHNKEVQGEPITGDDVLDLVQVASLIEQCILKIDTDKKAWNSIRDKNKNPFYAEFFAFVFIKEGLTKKRLQKAHATRQRLQNLRAKRLELDEYARIEKKKKKEKSKAEIEAFRREVKMKELDNKAELKKIQEQSKKDDKDRALEAQKHAAKLKQEAAQKEKDREQKAEENEKNRQNTIKSRVVAIQQVFGFVLSAQFLLGTIALLGAVIIIYYAAKYGLKLLFVKKPKIIQFTNVPANLWQRLFGAPKMPPVKGMPIYNKDVQKRYDELTELVKNVIAYKRKYKGSKAERAVFTNVAFKGIPGTGKTYGAMSLVWMEGKPMRYVIIPSAALAQMPVEEAVQTLIEIFDWIDAFIAKTGESVAILWDEFDAMGKPRSSGVSERNLQLINMLLALVPKPNHPYLFHIFITNLVLDPAIDSRVGIHFEVDPPKGSTLKKLLKEYIERAAEKFDLRIDRRFKDPESIQALADIMEQGAFTGRDVEQFFELLGTALMMQDSGKISYDMVKEGLITKVASRQKSLEASRKRAYGNQYVNPQPQPPLVAAAA